MSLPREAGEHRVLGETVAAVVDGVVIPESKLVLTDLRLVLLTPKKLQLRVAPARPLVRAFAENATVPTFTAEIQRDDFVEVELRDSELVFRGRATSFTVISSTELVVWQGRMRRWTTGSLNPTPLPTARVVKR